MRQITIAQMTPDSDEARAIAQDAIEDATDAACLQAYIEEVLDDADTDESVREAILRGAGRIAEAAVAAAGICDDPFVSIDSGSTLY